VPGWWWVVRVVEAQAESVGGALHRWWRRREAHSKAYTKLPYKGPTSAGHFDRCLVAG
jgi:hypothetical protein